MPKLHNPHYADPVAAWAEANKAAVDSWLAAPAQAALERIDFAALRAAFPALTGPGGEPLGDGLIAVLLGALGIEVEP